MRQKTKREPNRLIQESSPYLLQHAFNPVDWYPWGPEAFDQARIQDKPVFLSIGYSTCHWCHVMEKESFEDPQVAALLNADFIAVKVDREERPDIDSIYMSVCQLLTQRGGWPLTVILTPDKKPFFAGTYFPRTGRFGQTGMLELLPQLARLWRERREELRDSADQIIGALQETVHASPSEEVKGDVLQRTFEQLSREFDEEQGGFGRAPKFPIPHHLNFLLRYWKRTGDSRALQMVEKTLTAMRRGGIWDHVGFGFHRYSTDDEWLLPHFEKMLYDQALLAWTYIEAFLATGAALFQETAEEIFAYVLRDLTSPEGAFYSAEDADSEGVEGKFYTWNTEEVGKVLDPQDAELFCQVYNLLTRGNFKEESDAGLTGRNIPHLAQSWQELAERLGMEAPELRAKVNSVRHRLFSAREKRVRPQRDDKILTDWNGLMIAVLAKGAQAFGKTEYAGAAAKAAHFIWEHLYSPQEGLLHRSKDGVSGIPAYADDYAFSTWGLIELYQATLTTEHLEKALALNRLFISRFWDSKAHGFFFTSASAESLFLRKKEGYDGAVPSSNSVALHNLLCLGRLSGDPELEEKADQLKQHFSGDIKRNPSGYTHMLSALDFILGPSHEIVIVGDPQDADTQAMLSAIRTRFFPNIVVLLVSSPPDDPPIRRLAPFTAPYKRLDGKATAYVCSHFTCEQPTTDPQTMLRYLEE